MKNGMYKLHLNDDSSIVVHEEVILKKDLLITKKIDESDTIIDDMLLEKVKWFFNYLKARF